MDDSKFAKDWEKTRARGFGRYVVTQGARLGVSFTVFVLLGEWLSDAEFSLIRGLKMVAAFIVIGCIVAPLVWHQREDRYKRSLENSQP